MTGRVALLAGLFLAPAILLAVSHRLRERSDRGKRAFWGGVIGHIAGMCIASLAMFAPPVWWQGGPQLRDLIVHWAMLIAFLAGAFAGYFLVGPRSATVPARAAYPAAPSPPPTASS